MLPTLRTLQAAWPEARITWIIGKIEAQLVADIDGVEFIIFDKAMGTKAFFELRKKLHGQKFDLLLNMQVSPRAALVSRLINSPVRLGFDSRRGKFLHNLACNYSIPYTANQHVLDSFLSFTGYLGIDPPTLRWDIPIPTEAIESTRQLLGAVDQYLVINPCSSNRARNWRNWSYQHYAAVIDHAAANFGITTVLTGGPNQQEINYAEQIITTAEATPLNLVGKTSLKQLAALCQGAQAMISPDTGPAHIANAVGTPVIGLYASSNPDRTGPYSHRDLTVNCYPEALKRELGKAVSEVKWGQRVRNPQVMERIKVGDVIKRIEQVLKAENQDSSTSP